LSLLPGRISLGIVAANKALSAEYFYEIPKMRRVRFANNDVTRAMAERITAKVSDLIEFVLSLSWRFFP
jgi:hypothetical protein